MMLSLRRKLVMGFLDSAKKGLISNFNFKQWIGIGMLKQSTSTVYALYKDLDPRNASNKNTPAGQSQSFEDLMIKNGITEKELARRIRISFMTIAVYSLCLLSVLIYCIYLMVNGHYGASILSFVLVLVLLSFIFKEHFNYFQMKQRRLGCTFKDWSSALFRGNTK
jgi:intracellular multiplication protein IcmV